MNYEKYENYLIRWDRGSEAWDREWSALEWVLCAVGLCVEWVNEQYWDIRIETARQWEVDKESQTEAVRWRQWREALCPRQAVVEDSKWLDSKYLDDKYLEEGLGLNYGWFIRVELYRVRWGLGSDPGARGQWEEEWGMRASEVQKRKGDGLWSLISHGEW